MIYLIGVVVAFAMMLIEYNKTPKEERCNDSDAIGIIAIGSILSWTVPIVYLMHWLVKFLDKEK